MALNLPTLLSFRGPVGVGKSALSRAVGRRLGWPVVDKDDFSDVLLNLEGYGPLAYESMFSVTESLLRQGFSVICDSPLRGEAGYLRAEALAVRTSAELRLVSCTLFDEALWKTRIGTRERRPAHVIKTWEDLLRYREAAATDFSYPITAPVFAADMSAPLGELTEEAISWLDDPHGHPKRACWRGGV